MLFPGVMQPWPHALLTNVTATPYKGRGRPQSALMTKYKLTWSFLAPAGPAMASTASIRLVSSLAHAMAASCESFCLWPRAANRSNIISRDAQWSNIVGRAVRVGHTMRINTTGHNAE